jgi:hypothetical protein
VQLGLLRSVWGLQILRGYNVGTTKDRDFLSMPLI